MTITPETTTMTAGSGVAAIAAAMERDGFAMVERVLAASQLKAAQRAGNWSFQQPMERYKWVRQRLYEHHATHPIIVEVIEHPLAIAVASELLGAHDFQLIAAQCSRNTREELYVSGVTKLHQDMGLLPIPERRKADIPLHRYGFTAMWYLQDTPLEMGPTELIPRSHLSERSYDGAEPDPSAVFRCAVPAGSLLFFKHCTWHRGALNRTDMPRDLISNAYARMEVEREHLHTTQPDGSKRYVPYEPLRPLASALRRQLWGL